MKTGPGQGPEHAQHDVVKTEVEDISRTEFILRSCQERARDVLLDRTLFSLTPEQTTALLADVEDPCAVALDQASIERLLAMPQPWHAPA